MEIGWLLVSKIISLGLTVVPEFFSLEFNNKDYGNSAINNNTLPSP